jgi:hypothetical protein
MRCAPPGSLHSVFTHRVLPGLALFVCVLATAPEEAHGSCGDWLEGHAAHHPGDGHDPVDETPIDADWSGRGREPCKGPMCSKPPATPSSVPPGGEPAVDSGRDALLERVALPASPSVSWLPPRAHLTAVTGAGSSIDRPPIAG